MIRKEYQKNKCDTSPFRKLKEQCHEDFAVLG